MTQKKTDSIIDDIHRIRREISDRFNGDVFEIAADAACRQLASNRPVWRPKHDEQAHAPEPAAGLVSQRKSSPPAR
jgi:hypothetical protein